MYLFYEKKTKESLINIGTGRDMKIKDYVNFIIKKLNLKVKIKYDLKKPDGVYRKVLDVKLAKKYGWKSTTSLSKGFDITYKDFIYNYKKIQMRNILVITGGAGFVGSNLIRLLLNKTKYKIISIDNYISGNKKNHIKIKG